MPAALSGPASSSLADGRSLSASSAGAFVGSIGIDVHFNYYGSIYTSKAPLMISQLQALGIYHLRDGLCWQGPDNWNTFYVLHQQLASLGFKTDYVSVLAEPIEHIAAYPWLVNDMEAVEPANEYDLSGDPNWAADVTAQQQAIFAAVSDLRTAAPITVLAPSLAYPSDAPQLGNVSAAANAGNLHGYFGAYNPGSSVVNPAMLLAQLGPTAPGLPMWVTETGYFAQPGPVFGMWGVTPQVQAIYTPRALMEYWNAGAARTYLYELADDVEPAQDPGNFHWGLLDSNGNSKPAFTALQNLITLLQDPGPAYAPPPLSLSIQTSASSVHSTLFGKRDGSYYLAVWNEVQSYDFLNNQPLMAVPQTITLQLGSMPLYNGWQQFDQNGDFTTQSTLPTQTLTLPVSDKLQIITLIF